MRKFLMTASAAIALAGCAGGGVPIETHTDEGRNPYFREYSECVEAKKGDQCRWLQDQMVAWDQHGPVPEAHYHEPGGPAPVQPGPSFGEKLGLMLAAGAAGAAAGYHPPPQPIYVMPLQPAMPTTCNTYRTGINVVTTCN